MLVQHRAPHIAIDECYIVIGFRQGQRNVYRRGGFAFIWLRTGDDNHARRIIDSEELQVGPEFAKCFCDCRIVLSKDIAGSFRRSLSRGMLPTSPTRVISSRVSRSLTVL